MTGRFKEVESDGNDFRVEPALGVQCEVCAAAIVKHPHVVVAWFSKVGLGVGVGDFENALGRGMPGNVGAPDRRIRLSIDRLAEIVGEAGKNSEVRVFYKRVVEDFNIIVEDLLVASCPNDKLDGVEFGSDGQSAATVIVAAQDAPAVEPDVKGIGGDCHSSIKIRNIVVAVVEDRLDIVGRILFIKIGDTGNSTVV